MGTTAKLRLRDAVAADLPALLALEALFPGDRLSTRQLRRHLRSASARLRVATADAALAGYALTFFRRGSTVARLYSLAVAPALRGNGVGRVLLDDVADQARVRGCDQIRLEVRADNAAALRLYAAAGFAPLARLPGYYDDGGDGWRYRRALASA